MDPAPSPDQTPRSDAAEARSRIEAAGLAPSLRELVVGAGLEVLERDGLCLAAQSLSYAKVFEHLEREHGIKVTRASVHERIWASHADFRRDVLAEAIGHLPTRMFGAHAEALRADVLDMYDRGLGAGERIAEFSRRYGPLLLDMLSDIPAFRDVQMAKAIASPFNDPLTTDALQGSIRNRVAAVLVSSTARSARVITGLGLGPSRALGLGSAAAHELFALTVINLLVGAFLDVNAGARQVTEPVAFGGRAPTDDEPWTMLGVGLRALLSLLFAGTGAEHGPRIPNPPPVGGATSPRISGGSTSGRRPRRQLRELVLAAGVEVMLRERLDLRPESLSYASVFAHIRDEHGINVYRSSVHNRIWSSHDDYWLEVLTTGISSDPGVVGPAPDELWVQPAGALGSGSSVRQAAMDRLRRMTAAGMAQSLRSADFLRRQAIKAALLNEPDSPLIDLLRRAVHDSEQERVARHCEAVREHVVAPGFEVRPELGIPEDEALRMVVTLALTTVAGAVFDQSAGVQATARTYPIRRHDDGTRTDDWSAPSLATWAFFDLLFQARR